MVTLDEATVMALKANAVDGDWTEAWRPERHTFRSWLAAWIEGNELFDPRTRPFEPVE